MVEEKRKLWLLFIPLCVIIILTVIVNQFNTNNIIVDYPNTSNIDNDDEDINWDYYPAVSIELKESIEITKSGSYYLTGTLENGSIVIKLTKNDSIKLILDNVTIKNPSGPAISCLEADNLVIELIGENNLEDSEEYPTNLDEDVKGVIYSRSDLIFEGEGVLNINAKYADGVISKDDLKFKSGTYNIISQDDGVRGKDSVYFKNGNFSINAKADAIKTTNELSLDKGFIIIENGNYYLESGAKAIKAITNILIYGGNLKINSYDDAVHSNNYINIAGGNLEINSGDDGIHANSKLTIEEGRINILKSHEGLEAQVININGGNIFVLASDDGINAGGGADLSAIDRPGANNFKDDENSIITINGGEIYINAAGDGIDSNGYLYFNGGTTTIDGPITDKNGALDAGLGISARGGEVIAIGASGMAGTLGKKSTIYNIGIYFREVQPAGTKIEIKDEDGSLILNHISAKTFSHLTAGSKKFSPDKIYSIYINGEKYQDFVLSDIVTTIGEQNIIPHK